MRDGIFRSSCLPPRWKKVGRFAENAADLGERLAEGLLGALSQELALGFKDPAVKAIHKHISSNSLSLLDGKNVVNLLEKSSPPQTHLGELITKDIAYACSKGQSFNMSTFINSCGQALNEYSNSILQELAGHAFIKCSNKDYHAIVKPLTSAFNSTNYCEAVRNYLSPTKDIFKQAKRKEFNMDANLL